MQQLVCHIQITAENKTPAETTEVTDGCNCFELFVKRDIAQTVFLQINACSGFIVTEQRSKVKGYPLLTHDVGHFTASADREQKIRFQFVSD